MRTENDYIDSDTIKRKLIKFTNRQVYVFSHEMSHNQIKIAISDNLDYLINKIIKLNVTRKKFDICIEQSINMVVENEYIDWLTEDLRAAIWFNDFFDSSVKNSTPFKVHRRLISYSNFTTDLIRDFDTCYINDKDTHTKYYSRSPYTRDIVSKHAGRTQRYGSSSRERQRYDKDLNTYHINDISTNYGSDLSSINDNALKELSILQGIDTFPREDRKDRPRRTIDTTDQLEIKTKFIAFAKAKYISIKTPPKYLSWLNISDEQQLYWAVEYLESQGLLLKPYLFSAIKLKDLYDQICASIDAIDVSDTYDRGSIRELSLYKKDKLNKMRGAWSQKKFRDRKDTESAQEYLLSRKYMSKLEKLATENGVSNVEYLKHLIDEACENTK